MSSVFAPKDMNGNDVKLLRLTIHTEDENVRFDFIKPMVSDYGSPFTFEDMCNSIGDGWITMYLDSVKKMLLERYKRK